VRQPILAHVNHARFRFLEQTSTKQWG